MTEMQNMLEIPERGLAIKQLRYEFSYPGEIALHKDLPVITFRGAFGYALAQVIAREMHVPEFSDQVELYKKIFSPCNDGVYKSRNQDLARPFVLRGFFSRPDHRSFILDVQLFGQTVKLEAFFDKVIEVISFMGVGRNNRVCKMEKIFAKELVIADPEPDDFLQVRFITPCIRMKSHGTLFFEEIPFYTLFARLADRLRELDNLYGNSNSFTDDVEIANLKMLAKDVLAKRLKGGYYKTSRTSGRSGQTMNMEGFWGTMAYYGDFVPYRRYLKYLPYINLGRFNVFGCGWCEMKYLRNIV